MSQLTLARPRPAASRVAGRTRQAQLRPVRQAARTQPKRASKAAAAKATLLEHHVLVVAIAGLCLLGLPIVLSASAVANLQAGSSVYSLFVKQGIFLVLGFGVALVAARVEPSRLRRFHAALPIAGFGLLLAVFLPGIGHDAGGSSRWIGAGPIQIQPSEFMKLAVIVFAADLLARRARRPDHLRAVVRPLLQLVAVACVFIMKQPDLGSCIVIVCIAFSLLYAAGVPNRLLFSAFLVLAIPGVGLALSASYRRDRLLSFLNPFSHAAGSGYQVVQSLVTLGQGGLLGNGVGGSATTWGYLPNGHTDFIFAVIGGNLGVIGTMGVIAGFGAFAWAGFKVAMREKDAFTRYLAVGITCWIVVQAVINIGGVIDALPVTGIPLPFISYGGSALMMALCGAGILVGIARRQAPASAPVVRPAQQRRNAPARRASQARRPRPAS